MARYAVRKLVHTAFVALGVVSLVFVALRLSGDPAATMLPGEASVEDLVALRKALGLDQSLGVQYARFLGHAVRGDFGTSFRHQQPALGLVMERLPATLELAFAALFQEVIIYGVSKRLSFKPRADYRLIVAEMTLGAQR